jgi:hypothetical protein
MARKSHALSIEQALDDFFLFAWHKLNRLAITSERAVCTGLF